MFYVQNPSALNKPWILSKDEQKVISIPLEVSRFLSNYHIMAIEFLYHNYRKGMKGSILNQDPDMNFPLQLSAFLRAVVRGPALLLLVCSRETASFWQYHFEKHADLDVITVTTQNSKDEFKTTNKLILIVYSDCIKLCEDLIHYHFFSVVVEDLDQWALKRVVKKLNGDFNIGLTHRSFYIEPDQKLQWHMLNWANPGCVGKLNEFYAYDNYNFENFNDNYRYWWLRLTWDFCESFVKPTETESDSYRQKVEHWGSKHGFTKTQAPKRRKRKCEKTESTEVPSKYVELPSMDESPIVTSIIKNFEREILSQAELPYTQTSSSFASENSVILSFLPDEEKPSTSRSESEDFILNLI